MKHLIFGGDLRNPRDCDRFCQEAEGAILFHTAGIIHPKRMFDSQGVARAWLCSKSSFRRRDATQLTVGISVGISATR